ncbi:hypothetical protein OZ410_08200 [Robiginitalea sp. M366]|uniref:hypothetical protein n=1 Tax=Robiginitalea aestuariiviva TaxID=3036903 RepID=UPI00240D8E55|nr:hypothetical protein [Robiginitalea aestuariiviva]MDG1572293.1 hypothetical protein [Robiginitalea aestuariiviva]
MKKCFFLYFLLVCGWATTEAQAQITVRKGLVIDSLGLQDSVGSQLSLFLPSYFTPDRKWPLLFLIESEATRYQSMRHLKNAAEKNGYILASSRMMGSDIPLTQKVLYFSQSVEMVSSLVPLDPSRINVGGYGSGALVATLLPGLLNKIQGVLVLGSATPNWGLMPRTSRRFHFVGIYGQQDYRFLDMLDSETLLDQRKIPNHLLYFDGGAERPDDEFPVRGLQSLTLMAMARKWIPQDTVTVATAKVAWLQYVRKLRNSGQFLLAHDQLEEAIALLAPLTDVDGLRVMERELRRNNGYRAQRRDFEVFQLRERFMRDDFALYLEEDVLNFNLNNLGWWRFQMEKLEKHKASPKREEQLMGARLESYLNALVDEYLVIAAAQQAQEAGDEVLLRMVKTITSPKDFGNYLKLISLTSKYEDYGTALFYMEELLKQGFRDRAALYDLEHTALLRISPEFNDLVAKYLKDARYELPEPPAPEPQKEDG